MKKIEKFLQMNDFVFFFLYIVTFVASVIESIKYRGFIQKHLYISFETIFIITVISGLLTLIDPTLKKKIAQKVWNYYYQGQLFVFPFLFLFWGTLQFLNLLNYPNYVFSKFHIIPDNLLTTIFLSLFYIVIEKIHTIQTKYKKNDRQRNIQFVAFGIFVLGIFQLNIKTPFYIASELTYIVRNTNYNYREKMEKKWGTEAYRYIYLIRNNTPKNSKILLPPREDPWQIEGNDHLMRGFLYPRFIQSYKKGMNISSFDFILLSPGLWRNLLTEKNIYQFPSFDIRAKKIMIFDLKQNKIAQIIDDDFYSANTIYKSKFGLIEQ